MLSKDEVPLGEEELKEALSRHSSFHPECGTVLGEVFVPASGVFTVFLPLTPALFLGWLVVDGTARMG